MVTALASPPPVRLTSSTIHPAIRVMMTLLVGLALVAGLELTGFTAALDDALADGIVRVQAGVGVGSEDPERVVLVVADRETYAAWGESPWAEDRRARLVGAIAAGRPKLIAEVGHGALFEASSGPARDALWARAPDAGWTSGGLRHGELVDPHAAFAELGSQAGASGGPEQSAVRWRPGASIPKLSLGAVARGEIDPSRFAGKIVVVGIDDPDHRPAISTPLGRLSPSEVEAYALHGLVSTAPPAERPQGWRAAAALPFGLLALAALTFTARVRHAVIGLVALAALSLVADVAGHSYGWIHMGTGSQLAVLVALALSHWTFAWLSTGRALRGLEREVLGFATDAATLEPEEDPGFLADLTHFADTTIALVCPAARSMICPREAGASLTDMRLFAAAPTSELLERNCDLRHGPIRRAWQSLKLTRSRTLRAGHETLIMPLAVGDQCFGLWLVHCPDRASQTLAAAVEAIAAPMSSALARHETRRGLEGRARSTRERLERVVTALGLARDRQHAALVLVAEFPLPIMVATIWGDAELVGDRLREQLRLHRPGLLPRVEGANLVEIIVGLTGTPTPVVRQMMGRVATSGLAIELGQSPAREGSPELVWLLSRVSFERGLVPTQTQTCEYLVLSARSASERVDTLSTDPGSETFAAYRRLAL